MLTLDLSFELDGPLFDGRAERILDAYALAAEDEVADQGVRLVRHHLDRVLKNPNGFYEAHIRNRQTDSGHMVTDSRVIYGPWLEGTGERNKSTRFKGYATFRLVTGSLDRTAEYYADRAIGPYLTALGGERA